MCVQFCVDSRLCNCKAAVPLGFCVYTSVYSCVKKYLVGGRDRENECYKSVFFRYVFAFVVYFVVFPSRFSLQLKVFNLGHLL